MRRTAWGDGSFESISMNQTNMRARVAATSTSWILATFGVRTIVLCAPARRLCLKWLGDICMSALRAVCAQYSRASRGAPIHDNETDLGPNPGYTPKRQMSRVRVDCAQRQHVAPVQFPLLIVCRRGFAHAARRARPLSWLDARSRPGLACPRRRARHTRVTSQRGRDRRQGGSGHVAPSGAQAPNERMAGLDRLEASGTSRACMNEGVAAAWSLHLRR